ncbi:hypothetical protein [Catenulispora pinisilvae]|uniref:hypothetical protein n=1 Tax=Catenulispora pinisilvae TaxID=2705253 RepID=UPI001891C5EA|nr:hypothetical protein [Catenulispora pinisilvae]
MHRHPHSRSRSHRHRGRARRISALLTVVTLGFAALAATPAQAATQQYPTYTLDHTGTLNSGLTGDIAGSAFTDADGQFHWLSSYADYESTDSGSDTNTFTNTDLGALNNQVGSGTTEITADTYWNKPGALCYQIDKAAQNAAPSPYEDDHCDVVGTWVDPSSGTWYGVVNDEYDFNPWGSSSQTQNQRIGTGIHGNRILTASSSDKGKTWNYGGEIITSPYLGNDSEDASSQPGKTWDYGVAGCRLFVDYSTGYFYVVYNTQIKFKPNYTTFAYWPAVARAPISGKMAPGTWNKWDGGTWTQPGVGGYEGMAGSALHLNPSYDPATDQVDFAGTGADGTPVDYRAYYANQHGNTFTFDDTSGNAYTANTSTGVITDASGATVPSVSYRDPALNSSVTVSTASSKVNVAVTDATGATESTTLGGAVFLDTATNRLYITPNVVQETAFTFNPFSLDYQGVGYDANVYQTSDLGNPDSLSIVGTEPSGASNSYLTSIDYGSLTNQNVSSRSYRMVSALTGGMWDVSMAPHSSGQTHYSAQATPVDAGGAPISFASSASYGLSVGGATLSAGSGSAWRLVPVMDQWSTGYRTGFYKLVNVGTGGYLQSTGSTVEQTRAIGSAVATGAQQANFDPSGNGGSGSPGGADQWYLQPIGNDAPQTLSPSSSTADIAAATNTSLAGVGQYKLVNRNSGLALEYVNGGWQLAGQAFGDSGQAVAITKIS